MSECLAMSKGKATDGERRGEEGSASGRAHNPIEWWQKPEAKQSQQRPCKKGASAGDGLSRWVWILGWQG